VVPPNAALPRLPIAHAVWAPKPDLMAAAEMWLRAGGPHHTCLTLALDVEAFADFAEIAGIELAVIEDRTVIGDFEKELRWNELYYMLSRNAR
jgi:L-arabinose isomerase